MNLAKFTAVNHLDNAEKLVHELSERWDAILSLDPIAVRVAIAVGGTGKISASFHWDLGEREAITSIARDAIAELWAALDATVAEAFDALSVMRAPRDAHRPRYFPIADSSRSFNALLGDSCLDGVLTSQYQLVRSVQPFASRSGDERVDQCRQSLRILLAWDHALRDDALLEAWATPTAPEVIVEHGHVGQVTPSARGPLREGTVLASFTLEGYTVGEPIQARPGCYIDLALADTSKLHDIGDGFIGQLESVCVKLRRFVVLFSSMADKVGGSRRVLLGDRGTPWKAVSDSGRIWSQQQLRELQESETGVGVLEASGSLSIIVATPDGVFERVVPDVTPLRPFDRSGRAAEVAVSDAAATWGLPDFVYAPPIERKGKGVREVADGLIVVGHIGAIVQSKARETDPGDETRERNWIIKQALHGVKQATGSARRLRTAPTTMRNGRGRSLPVDGAAIRWVGVVVVDHPNPPTRVDPPDWDGPLPIVTLLRRDWEFLFEQLRSTHAVVSYLIRVADNPIPFGTEPERYYELAQRDARATPGEVDPRLSRIGIIRSHPILPTQPAGTDNDTAHGIVRIILEDIATIPATAEEELPRQKILASIDSLPVAHRTELGEYLLNAFETLSGSTKPGEFPKFAFRTFITGLEADQIGFGVCSDAGDQVREMFHSWLETRHHQRVARLDGADDLTTVGILLTPRSDGLRRWDTAIAALRGDLQLTSERVTALENLWGAQDLPSAP